jgi:hypothetical protein
VASEVARVVGDAAFDDTMNLANIANVVQRIGLEDHEIGELTGFVTVCEYDKRPQPVTIGMISCGELV